ncbi:MAG: bifunctional diguanylate cyclase/phosphodiesterase, partial [Actinomycetota bacterium]
EGGGVHAVVTVDLDGFAAVNEALGVEAGDRVLVECARRLQEATAGAGVLARIGDDEIAAAVTGDGDAIDLAEAALAAMRVPMLVDGRQITVLASVGVAIADDEVNHVDLVQAANGALARAKERGGDRVEVFDPVMLSRARRRSDIEQELRRGIQARQLVVHYQPQVSMVDGRINGVEALVRWDRPEHGLVFPGAFLDVVEETGLMASVGREVLRQSCADAMTMLGWRRDDPSFTVSVNVAASQLRSADLVDTVVDELHRSGLDPRNLCLEVTESSILDSSLRVESSMDQLRELGVRFSIDDFGTGYSSLAYLRRLRVDELKIDRSFIVAMDDPEGARLVRAICGIAAALGLDIVAEGVDDDAAVAPLRGWGCDVIQGFLYAKPMPLDKLRRMIRKDRPFTLPDPAGLEAPTPRS